MHQQIYETLHLDVEEVRELLAVGSTESIVSRRESIHRFLEANEWSLDKYKKFLRGEFLGQGAKPLPSKATMAKNVALAGKQALMSGFKEVSDEEQKKRHAICQSDCQYYREEDDRCSKCGCFTTYKSRLEAWHCPIDKW